VFRSSYLGRALFPPVGQSLYPLSLGPHAFYWFELETSGAQPVAIAGTPAEPMLVEVPMTKLGFLHSQARELVEPALQAYLQETRWAGGEHDEIKSVRFADIARLPNTTTPIFLSVVEVDYVDGTSRTLCLATGVISEERLVGFGSSSRA